MRGTHTTIIEAARPLIRRLQSVAEISVGVIDPRAKSHAYSIKILRLTGGWQMTVVAKSSKQQFKLYNVDLPTLAAILDEDDFAIFKKTFPKD